jgi:hypothetical protein
MLVFKNAAPARVVIDLGHGAKAHAHRLDAFAVKAVAAETRAELNALRNGEPTQRRWSTIPADRIEAAKASDDAANALFGWMHAVLTATASVDQLDGVEQGDGVDETGAAINPRPLAASFEAFELLFLDATVETLFRMQAPALERIWEKEKNVSASGPNGSGPEATISAPNAGTPATPAPSAASETFPQASSASPMTDAADPAPSAPTPPEQPRESSPGNTAPPPASGASSAAD